MLLYPDKKKRKNNKNKSKGAYHFSELVSWTAQFVNIEALKLVHMADFIWEFTMFRVQLKLANQNCGCQHPQK